MIAYMFLFIQKVFAEGSIPGGSSIPSASGLEIKPPTELPKDVCALLNSINDYLIIIVTPIAGLMILWAAFQILTAAGDPAKLDTGKRTIVYALVGLGVVLLSKGIVAIITNLLGAGTGSLLCPK